MFKSANKELIDESYYIFRLFQYRTEGGRDKICYTCFINFKIVHIILSDIRELQDLVRGKNRLQKEIQNSSKKIKALEVVIGLPTPQFRTRRK